MSEPDSNEAFPNTSSAAAGWPRRRTLLTGAAGLALAAAFGPFAAGVAPESFGPPGWRPKPGGDRPAWLPNTLTDQQWAGQRVIYSYPGLTPPSGLLSALSSGQAAGVIFFGENISSESQIAGVVRQLRQAAAQAPVKAPPLLMTDQEGGLVRRLPGQPTLSEKQVGESSNPVAAASAAGTGAGQNLAGVGMNVNLAPVLDVFYTAGNFIDQFQRSYSNNANTAASCGQAFISAQQALKVAATAKHFPGLGSAATSQNTDLGPVTLNVSLTQLHTIDEVPYPSAISAGVKLVMASWAVYPALDGHFPAGLSPTIIGGELRGRNGFTGVTITDAIEAGALNAFGSTGQRAVSAASAGMDLILCSARDITQGQGATTALAAALSGGQLDATAFKAAANRVFGLRTELF